MFLVENFKLFLESSTIHGLIYWSTSKRLAKLFWILVVITGFSIAGFMINLSFQDWSDNPVKTTIETLPISQVKLPKITVCPPRDTYTNLNYDLMKLGNKKFDIRHNKKFREKYTKRLQNIDFQQHLKNFNDGFIEQNQFRNWYTGKR